MKAKTIEGEAIDARVRRRLREVRTERGLTLQQVADTAKIDLSTLSRLESGQRRLALDHLPRLADALGISADELLRAPAPEDPRIRNQPRTCWGITFWPLTRHGPAGGLHAYKIRIHADRTTPPTPLPVHDGHDWIYVLSGQMRLLLGEQDLVVAPGEAVEFSTWTPHWFGAIDRAVEAIAILGPHGERLHLHA